MQCAALKTALFLTCPTNRAYVYNYSWLMFNRLLSSHLYKIFLVVKTTQNYFSLMLAIISRTQLHVPTNPAVFIWYLPTCFACRGNILMVNRYFWKFLSQSSLQMPIGYFCICLKKVMSLCIQNILDFGGCELVYQEYSQCLKRNF